MTPTVTAIERGRGPTLVFLHGLGGSARSFAREVECFAGRYRVLAWDMPGYGESAPIDPPATMSAYAERLAAWLAERGVERAVLVGHSIGGMILLSYALAHPERVRALVLCAATAHFGGGDGRFAQSFRQSRLALLQSDRPLDEQVRELIASMVGERPDPAGLALARKAASGVRRRGFQDALDALLGFDVRPKLAEIRCPVLVLAGERDRQAPASTLARLAQALPKGRLVVVPGAGHLLHHERPDIVHEQLVRFLEEVDWGRAP